MRNRLSHTATAVAMTTALLAAGASAAEITPLERDSSILLTLSNLNFIPGTTDTPDPILYEQFGLTSADDIFIIGNVQYGPDGFGRINNGNYEALQDVTIEPGALSADLTQSCSVNGDASPAIILDNTIDFYFTVSDDTGATLDVDFDGSTNTGTDLVEFRLRRVESDGTVLETLFNLFATGLDGSGSVSETVSLIAGERYYLFGYGRARSLVTTGPADSFVRTTLTLDVVPCNGADLAEPYGLLDLSDINAFSAAFLAQDDAADLVDDDLWDLADINAFVSAFTAGCP